MTFVAPKGLGGKMINLKQILLICIVMGFISEALAQEPAIFLCIDSMKQALSKTGETPPKLVYGYVAGKKTECMSEHELRALYSQTSYNSKKASEPDSQQILEKRGLRRKTLSKTTLDAIQMGQKNLAKADLRGRDLKGIDFSGANLRGANLESADLRGANLNKADLREANLEYAYLKSAELRGSDLTNAKLKGTYFQMANLTDVFGLTLDNLRQVTSLYKAVLDTEMADAVKEYCPNRLKDPGFQWQASYFPEQTSIPQSERSDRKQFR